MAASPVEEDEAADALEARQPDLLAALYSCVSSFASPGVYDEDRADPARARELWRSFMARVTAVYTSKKGLRAAEKQRTRERIREAVAGSAEVRAAFERLGCTPATNMRVLARAVFSPRPSAADLAVEAAAKKVSFIESFLREVSGDDTAGSARVVEGLVRKGSARDAAIACLHRVRATRAAELCRARAELESARRARDADEQRAREERDRELLRPLLAPWAELDSAMGRTFAENGARLEQSCTRVCTRVVARRLGVPYDRVSAHLNATWVGVRGEVDIVLVDHVADCVVALVECKASPFDVAAADAQSGPGYRAQQGKALLAVPGLAEPMPVGPHVPCFVVTVLAKQYWLGYETKLRDMIGRALSAHRRCEREDEMFEKAARIVSGRPSPARWIAANAEKRLVVLPPDSELHQ
eukprot:m51a1_g2882 hypothetical protein (414) ;mRNA; f:395750-396991